MRCTTSTSAFSTPRPRRSAGLLDDIGGPHDALWPSPEWSPMWLDGPPAIGIAGGHGPLRYRVTTYEPGRRIVFTLDARTGAVRLARVRSGAARAGTRRAAPRRGRAGARSDAGCSGRAWCGRCTTGSSSRSSTGPRSPSAPAPREPTRLSAIARLARWTARSRARATVPPGPLPCVAERRSRRRLRRAAAAGHAHGSGGLGVGDLRRARRAGCGVARPAARRWSGSWASNARGARRSPSATYRDDGDRRRGRPTPGLSGEWSRSSPHASC